MSRALTTVVALSLFGSSVASGKDLSAEPAPDRSLTSLVQPAVILPIQLQNHREQNRRSGRDWGRVVTDIARHLPADRACQDAYRRYTTNDVDLVTAAHEWTHFLNGYLSRPGYSAYYLLDGRYITLADPEGLRGILPNIPGSLRGVLYELYLVENRNNARIDPLYLLDEWTAYTNDVVAAIAQLDEGKPLNPFCHAATQPETAANALEFTFYGFAVGMAVKEHDPRYYAGRQGKKLREFIAWNAQRSIQAYAQAVQRPQLANDDSRNGGLIRSFRNSADTAAMRAWVASDLTPQVGNLLQNVDDFSGRSRRVALRVPDEAHQQ